MTHYSLVSTTGQVASGQNEFVAVPRGGGRGKPAVIVCHSNRGLAYEKWNGIAAPNETKLLDRFTRAGLVVITADLDLDYGSSGWGNPTVQSRIAACVTLAAAQGAHATRYSLWGVSMGSTVSMIQTAHDTSNVAAMAIGMPLPDLEGLRALTFVNSPPIQDEINTAWAQPAGSYSGDGTHGNIQQGGVDVTPMNSTRESALAPIPKQVYYSSGDKTVMAFSTQLTAWAAAVGVTLVECGTQDHGDQQVADYPAATITKFLANTA